MLYDLGWRRSKTAITQECCEQYWTSPGGNTPQGTNYTATCLPSRKLSKWDEPDMQDTAGEAGTSSSVMYSYGPPHMAGQKHDDLREHTYSSYVKIQCVALKTCWRRWTIGRSGERGSEISMLAAPQDDDDEDDINFDLCYFTALMENILNTTVILFSHLDNFSNAVVWTVSILSLVSYFCNHFSIISIISPPLQ